MTETIALFGGTGLCGKHFLKLALEKGFKVQALLRTPSKVPEDLPNKANLTIIEGDLANKDDLTKTVKGADYVVSMAGVRTDKDKPKEYPTDFMLTFVQTLAEVIPEACPQVKVMLYQAGTFCPTPERPLTLIHSMIKTVVGHWMLGIGPNIQDNTNVIQYLHDHKATLGFSFIVSRPAAINDKEGGKETLRADHFSPTNFPITAMDLAVWSLQAMQDPALYGTTPFVVPVDKDLLAAATTITSN